MKPVIGVLRSRFSDSTNDFGRHASGPEPESKVFYSIYDKIYLAGKGKLIKVATEFTECPLV
ncbi:hypothetical protein KYC_14737 [Achromobacter arsenitoxydans SY8]|uniref:Uncharacterized protein n=1 Tax=Achromobacter arsenitoxydans SY8 TaxID=477184 RepID=H0F849_9BURK|nr:hypothetical protein KYC_14737 [Achromobacter arsenitoxydans SY8]